MIMGQKVYIMRKKAKIDAGYWKDKENEEETVMLKEEKDMLLKGLNEVLDDASKIEDVMRLLEQIERWKKSKIVEKQKEGIKKARDKGVALGRPVLEVPDNFDEILLSWSNGELTAQTAARMCGIGVSTFYRRTRVVLGGDGKRNRGKGDELNEISERK